MDFPWEVHNLTSLELQGAELVKMFVTPNWIVEAFNVLKDFRSCLLPCFVNLLFDFSLFKLRKNDSATALSQQFPLRLILGLKRFSLHQRLNSSLYLKNVRKFNDFQTPIVVKVSDESEVRLMPLSDLEERFESTHMDLTQNADYSFLTKLANED